jgi:hypothetical protein
MKKPAAAADSTPNGQNNSENYEIVPGMHGQYPVERYQARICQFSYFLENEIF